MTPLCRQGFRACMDELELGERAAFFLVAENVSFGADGMLHWYSQVVRIVGGALTTSRRRGLRRGG